VSKSLILSASTVRGYGFTGPSSAMNPTVKVNKSKARKFKLTEVTERTIAYVSVQVCDYFSAFHV